MKSIFYLLFIILFDIQCNIGSAQNNSYADVLLKHPATDLNNYNQKGVWEDRIYNIDELRIDYVKQINLIDGFSEIPQPTKSMNQMKSLILQIAKNLNPQVKPLFEKYIYGIYFCEKLGGTGLTGYIYNNEE
ncbi:MAG TPA: hypothetical protein PKX55_00760, partial [Leptospiraceae bacterium]|nr:hypothetical protein [Leptospiraceae bacterium]